MKITAILIALVMIATASAFAYGHDNPNSPLGVLGNINFQFATLQNSPSETFPLYAGGGAYNDSGSNLGTMTLTVLPSITPYEYSNKPYIASSINKDSVSTPFSELYDLNATWTNNIEFWLSGSPQIVVSMHEVVSIQGTNFYQSFGWVNITTPLYGVNNIEENANLINEATITGLYNSVVTITTFVTITNTVPNGYGTFGAGVFHKEIGQVSRQVLILPASASLNQPPTPIKQGTPVTFTYSTGYAPVNNLGNGYNLIIVGSPAYNNGATVLTVPIGDNIQNGQYTYTIPQNAFVNSSVQNANLWEVELADNNFGLIYKFFFTIDNYSYEPPAPTIKITNPPVGKYVYGENVNVEISVSTNSITNTPISYVEVWVYSAISENQPAQYIIDKQIINTNGHSNVSFSFDVPANPNSIYIQVISVDEYGRSSNMATFDISSLDIIQPGVAPPPINYVYEIVAILAAVIGSLVIFFFLPIDMMSRVVIILGYVGSVAILAFTYL